MNFAAMLERRRRLRRAVSGGAVLGAAGALLLALVEIVWVSAVARDAFGHAGDLARFAASELALLGFFGALLGAPLGLLRLCISFAAERLARRRTTAATWAARLYAIGATPPIALICAMAFRGRRARTMPHKDLLALLVGLCAVALFYLAARLAVRGKERIGRGLVSRGRAFAIALMLCTLAVGLYGADQRVLPRLYGFFHVALAAAAFAMAQLGLGAAHLSARLSRPRLGRLCDPSFALGVLLASGAGGLWALSALGHSDTLRFVLFERAVVCSKTLEVAGLAGVLPARAHHAAAGSIETPPAILPAGPRLPGADIFLISVDALRADHVGAYGYSRPTTPNIDREAARGVVFERAYSQVPHTSFSLATLLTGKYVYSLAALGKSDRHETLAEILRRYRYKTAAFYPPAVFYIDEKKFTTYQESNFGFEYVKFEYLDADRRVDQIIDFLETEKPARTFVWVHFFEPHEPYDTHPGISFGDSAVDRYDGEIAYVDRAIGRLLDYVHRARPGAIVAITADHGEEFGEHGGRYHGTSLYDEQVHVPVILNAPDLGPRRIARPVETVDLAVTLLSLVDVMPPAVMRGTDLGPWLSREPVSSALLPPAFAEIETKKMVAEGDDKLICDTARDYCELYDLAQDPAERHNHIADQPDRAAALRGHLDAWIASHSRLESETDFRSLSETARRALERGRLGDAGAVPDLARLLSASDPAVRREAARLLARLPPDERARQALASALGDPGAGPWAATALARFCDPEAQQRLGNLSDGDAELDARAGIALARCKAPSFDLLARGMATDDVALRRRVIVALGGSGDPRAIDLLLGKLEMVLEREQVVQALGATGAHKVAPALVHVLRSDPYVHVRAQAAHALARVEGTKAVPALRSALADEKEEPVRAAINDELAKLRR